MINPGKLFDIWNVGSNSVDHPVILAHRVSHRPQTRKTSKRTFVGEIWMRGTASHVTPPLTNCSLRNGRIHKGRKKRLFFGKITCTVQKFQNKMGPSVSSILEVGRISLFPLLALWGNKNWPPVWKRKSWKHFRTKWAQRAASGPVWMPQALPPLCLTQVGRIQPSPFLGNKGNGLPSMKVLEIARYWQGKFEFLRKDPLAALDWSSG